MFAADELVIMDFIDGKVCPRGHTGPDIDDLVSITLGFEVTAAVVVGIVAANEIQRRNQLAVSDPAVDVFVKCLDRIAGQITAERQVGQQVSVDAAAPDDHIGIFVNEIGDVLLAHVVFIENAGRVILGRKGQSTLKDLLRKNFQIAVERHACHPFFCGEK